MQTRSEKEGYKKRKVVKAAFLIVGLAILIGTAGSSDLGTITTAQTLKQIAASGVCFLAAM